MANVPNNTVVPPQQLAQMGEKPSVGASFKKAIAKLSLREKVMIWALVIIAIVMALIFLLILPAQDRLMAAEQNNDTLINEENRTRLTIASMPTNQEVLAAAQARYDENLDLYQADMLPEDIDRMITGMIVDAGFSAVSLSMGPFAYETVESFTGEASAWEQPSTEVTPAVDETTATGEVDEGQAQGAEATGQETTVQGGSATNDATSGLDTAVTSGATGDEVQQGGSSDVKVYTVYVTMNGYEESYYAFLDRVIPLSWMKIETSTFNPPPTLYADYAALEQSYSFTLKLYVHDSATVKNP